jgi:hypothetical protein
MQEKAGRFTGHNEFKVILDEPHTVQVKVDDFWKIIALPGG